MAYPGVVIGNQVVYPFEKDPSDVLMRLDQEWKNLVPRSRMPESPGMRSRTCWISGLHASSAEFHQRFAMGLEQLHNMLKLQQFDLTALRLDLFLRNAWFGIAQDFGADVGESPTS